MRQAGRGRVWAGLRAGAVLAGWLIGDVAAQSPQTAADDRREQQVMQERVERLASRLETAQAQVDALRSEVETLRREVDAAKAESRPATGGTGTAASTGGSAGAGGAAGAGAARTGAEAQPETAGVVGRGDVASEDAVERMREVQEVLAAEVKQHEQTKVEGASKFPVRVTGLVVFNAFVNQGVVDQVDLPTVALLRAPGASHGSVGGSLRQTWLGLEGRGPLVGGFRTSARVSLDFFGGVSGGVTAGSTNLVRLRTGAVRAETARDVLEARYDEPLISPLSPVSLASVAQPALAWSGKLWVWAPELRWQHRAAAGAGKSFDVEAGLRDSTFFGGTTYGAIRAASPAELGRQPAYEGRLSYGSDSAQDVGSRLDGYGVTPVAGWRVGGGGYFAKQSYGSSGVIRTWAITSDWTVPLRRWLRVSGEAYRGTGLGGLGGGAYRDVVQSVDPAGRPTRTVGLDAGGGWVQLQADLNARWRVDGAFGQDAGSGSELRLFAPYASDQSYTYYARNRTITGNVVYRPWSSVVLSPEYRRITSWPISGARTGANVFTLSAGYQF